MPTYVCPVAASADDYDSVGTGSALLDVLWTNVTSPATIRYGWTLCDTSAIPTGETVISVIYSLYEDSYTASKGLAKTYVIFGLDSGLAQVASSGSRTYVGGWQSWTLPSSFYPYVYKGAGAKTNFQIAITPDPGAAKFRNLKVRTLDYPGFPAYVTVITAGGRSYVFQVG